MTRRAGTATAGLPLLLVCGCAGEVSTGTGAVEEPTPTCLGAEAHSDLAWIEENVLASGCAAFASCHKDGAPSAGGLDLGRGMAMANLVDVPSALEPSMDLVEPGAPEDSYLLVILGHYGADDPRIDPAVGTMPANNALLCAEKRDAIERWIAELAPALDARIEIEQTLDTFDFDQPDSPRLHAEPAASADVLTRRRDSHQWDSRAQDRTGAALCAVVGDERRDLRSRRLRSIESGVAHCTIDALCTDRTR